MKNNTRKLLLKCGVPQHLKGYQYLGTAIDAVYEDPDILNRVTKTLYPEIAKEYNTTSSRVERAIRNAIEVAWDRSDYAPDVRNELFGHTIDASRGKPTNSHFIAALVEALNSYEID